MRRKTDAIIASIEMFTRDIQAFFSANPSASKWKILQLTLNQKKIIFYQSTVLGYS